MFLNNFIADQRYIEIYNIFTISVYFTDELDAFINNSNKVRIKYYPFAFIKDKRYETEIPFM